MADITSFPTTCKHRESEWKTRQSSAFSGKVWFDKNVWLIFYLQFHLKCVNLDVPWEFTARSNFSSDKMLLVNCLPAFFFEFLFCSRGGGRSWTVWVVGGSPGCSAPVMIKPVTLGWSWCWLHSVAAQSGLGRWLPCLPHFPPNCLDFPTENPREATASYSQEETSVGAVAARWERGALASPSRPFP